MTRRWARRVRSIWFLLALVALCVLVSVILHIQNNYYIKITIIPRFDKIRSFTFGPDNTIKSNSYFTSFSSQYKKFNDSIVLVSSKDHATTTERPFLREPVINPHEFNYVITPNVTCSNEDVALVICVTTRYSNYEGRSVIRRTWGSYAYNTSNKARLLFFIGTMPSSQKSAAFTQRNITQESSQYGDLLQEDFVDSYKNLSLKSVSMLKWVSLYCSTSRFFLKVDDDMYVNIPLLVKILREYSSDTTMPEAYIIGRLFTKATPYRNRKSKWYIPLSEFSGDVFPDYVTGAAYAMPGTTVALLYQASLRVPLFWLEDVYITGFCAKHASVKSFNSHYFSSRKAAVSGCSLKSRISAHGYTNKEKLQIHKELYDHNLRC